MPNYYSGANATTSFSEGLMAGYDFVDRIQSRKRQLDLEERAQARADRQMEIAEDVNADRNTQFDFEMDRAQTTAGQQDTLFGQGQDDRKVAVSERDRAIRVRDEVEGARTDLAGGMLSGGGGLGAIGAAGLASGPPGTARRAATPVPQTEQPAGPVDLRAAQRDIDNAPGFVDRIKTFVGEQREGHKTQNAERFWGSVVDTNNAAGTSYSPTAGHTVELRDVRLNPAKYADQYLKERERVSPEARATLDLTMSNALKDRSMQLGVQIGQLDAADPRNAGKIRSLGNDLIAVNRNIATLAKSATSSAAADAGITRPVKVDDARVVPAITAAADKARQVQPILDTTPDELRAAMTVVTRAGSAKRLNQKQMSALTTLYAHGQIDAEQLTNWSKYGTPIAPKQPTVQALGGGYAAVVSDGGISLLRLPGDSKTEPASSRSNQRMLVNDRLKQINDGLQGMVEAGELSDGSANQHFNKFLQIVKREAPNLQLKSGIPLLGADGALNIGEADPGEVAELLSSYSQYDKGEEQPWFFKGGKTFSEYAPQAAGGESIIDLTSAF